MTTSKQKEPGDWVKTIKVRKMDFEFSVKILEPKHLFPQIVRERLLGFTITQCLSAPVATKKYWASQIAVVVGSS